MAQRANPITARITGITERLRPQRQGGADAAAVVRVFPDRHRPR